jgi:hypothetical protein
LHRGGVITAACERPAGRFEDALTLARDLEFAPCLRAVGLRLTAILSCQLSLHDAHRAEFAETLA